LNDRISKISGSSFAPGAVRTALENLFEFCAADDLDSCPDSFLRKLGELLTVSPPMLDTIRAHPAYLGWLRTQLEHYSEDPSLLFCHDVRWENWKSGKKGSADIENLRAFKRREYLFISFLDVAGMLSFERLVQVLSELAVWVINAALRLSWEELAQDESVRWASKLPREGFAVIAVGKLGGRELNYSSDVDLIFCRRNPQSSRELDFFSKLGERFIRALSKIGLEGFLYRVDMRLRPHGTTGPLVPTIESLISYYESWGEPWERQALIKARFIAGTEEIGKRFQSFLSSFTFARQLDEAALEEIKRVKHRSEKEFAGGPGINLKHGPGGIRDIEFYVQFSQLTIGWRYPEVRTGNTLDAISALARMKVLLEGEERELSRAYAFLRIVEHHLQLRALTASSVLPDSPGELELLARGLGFETNSAAAVFIGTLNGYRSQVRGIIERVYLAPGYLRLTEREEELAQLLSERVPKERVGELLAQYGFKDIEKAWQNIRLLALGPAGLLLPPGERRAFLEFAFPLLEVLRETIDPDQALHNLEDVATATGNRVSFLRTLASRRPHLSRLTNLLALSNLSRQILSTHPEYFDSLARGIFLHEGRQQNEMHSELEDRVGASPRGEKREHAIRRYRHREMVRIAYRDVAGLADSLEVSRELSDLASACIQASVDWTRPPYTDPAQIRKEHLRIVAMGKLGSRQMHYSSDLDLIFLYEGLPEGVTPDEKARFQQEQDVRVEQILDLLSAVTPEGITYSVDLRLRPGGSASTLARSWESLLEYARSQMQPWERMALVRSRMLSPADEHLNAVWQSFLSDAVYGYEWDDDAFESIRHVKRRIEAEKSRETRTHLDFKYGKGGIADLEFLVQFLQIKYGRSYSEIRTSNMKAAIEALFGAGILSRKERDTLFRAHAFERLVENRYQLMEEWMSREVSRESPMLVRLAGSLGYRGDASSVRKSFLSDWGETASAVRRLVEKYFYSREQSF
jgi:glutamate-ammonia-ligase adenylyltransferase